MATTETSEYRMNLCTDRSPRVGESTRSTAGHRRTALTRVVFRKWSYKVTRSPAPRGVSEL
jgi:hypothetical protein